MYIEHFGLKDKPFRLSPDARYFFPSNQHRRALAFLEYGMHEGEGFILITGEPGTGKSTIVSKLMQEHASDPLILATIETSSLAGTEILDVIVDRFRFERTRTGGKAGAIQALRQGLMLLLRQGRRALLIVDEAQSLPNSALEELRMLSNMQGPTHPLLQIFLVGQPDLARRLRQPDMEQLRQRITAAFHLLPFNTDDVREYVQHRLGCVGWSGRPAFEDEVWERIHHFTGGTPRLINVLCDRLMLFAFLEERDRIRAEDVEVVANETGMTEFSGGSDDDAGPDPLPPNGAASNGHRPAPGASAAPGEPTKAPRTAAPAASTRAALAGEDPLGLVRELIDRLAGVENRLQQLDLRLRLDIAALRSAMRQDSKSGE